MSKTKIEWAEEVWNPVVGCTKISQGCKNCYAEKLHNQRHESYKQGLLQNIPQYAEPFSRIQIIEKRIDQPRRWKRPRTIFVNSVSDLFHEEISDHFQVEAIIQTMIECDWHKFIVLTKRSGIMLEALRYFFSKRWFPKHVYWGVSIEDQKTAYERVPDLIEAPIGNQNRFLSIEPLLGPISLEPEWLENLGGVIVGGESGPNARPMHPMWVRSLRDACQSYGVAFMMKQWGEWFPSGQKLDPDVPDERMLQAEWTKIDFRGNDANSYSPEVFVRTYSTIFTKLGKKATGRFIDGQEHDELPWGDK